jgi:hypothetical protein
MDEVPVVRLGRAVTLISGEHYNAYLELWMWPATRMSRRDVPGCALREYSFSCPFNQFLGNPSNRGSRAGDETSDLLCR